VKSFHDYVSGLPRSLLVQNFFFYLENNVTFISSALKLPSAPPKPQSCLLHINNLLLLLLLLLLLAVDAAHKNKELK
jgi:hypothetical protein